MKKIKVTFSAPKYLAKEFKKPVWDRVPSGTSEWNEILNSVYDAKLKAAALGWEVLKIEELK